MSDLLLVNNNNKKAKKKLSIFSTPMQVLIYIYEMKEGSLMDLVGISKMSWHTIQTWIPVLEENGLITVTEDRTVVGSYKKVVRLTEKGKIVAEKLIELSRELSNIIQ